jgi:hypothetical protein
MLLFGMRETPKNQLRHAKDVFWPDFLSSSIHGYCQYISEPTGGDGLNNSEKHRWPVEKLEAAQKI